MIIESQQHEGIYVAYLIRGMCKIFVALWLMITMEVLFHALAPVVSGDVLPFKVCVPMMRDL